MRRPGTPVVGRPLLRSRVRRRRNDIRRFHQTRRCYACRRHIRRRPLIDPGVLNGVTRDARSPTVVPTGSTLITFADRLVVTATTGIADIGTAFADRPTARVGTPRATARQCNVFGRGITRRGHGPPLVLVSSGRGILRRLAVRRPTPGRRPTPPRTTQTGADRPAVDIFSQRVRDSRLSVRAAQGGLHGPTVHKFRWSITLRRRHILRRPLISPSHNTSRERGQSTIGGRDVLGRCVPTPSSHTTTIRSSPRALYATGRITPGRRQVPRRPLVVAGRNATLIRGFPALSRRCAIGASSATNSRAWGRPAPGRVIARPVIAPRIGGGVTAWLAVRAALRVTRGRPMSDCRRRR